MCQTIHKYSLRTLFRTKRHNESDWDSPTTKSYKNLSKRFIQIENETVCDLELQQTSTLQHKRIHGSFSTLISTAAFLPLEDMLPSASSSAARLLLTPDLSAFVGVMFSSVCDSRSLTISNRWLV